ncbi:eCIS core domain-containing protein [Saccharopolyspora sp. NPDC002376]
MRHHNHSCQPDRPHQRSRAANGHSGDNATTAAALAGAPLSPTTIRALQRTVGNAAVNRMLAERQRAAEVQRSAVHDVLRSAGQPLDQPVRTEMESRLGNDFSDVRVHTDGAAHTAAESVQAHAFTSGSHIVFQRGRYDTSSTAGKHMLAHELTHVVQQRSGPVAGTSTADGLKVSDPSDAFERAAEANADRAMAEPVQRRSDNTAQNTGRRPTAGNPESTAVQRDVGFEIEVTGTKTFALAPPFEQVAETLGTNELRHAVTLNTEINGAESEWHDLTQDPPVKARRLAKMEPLVDVPGLFTVEADDAFSGGSNLEFVTAHFPEGKKGRRRLAEAISRIRRVAAQLDGSLHTANSLAAAARGTARVPSPPSDDAAAEYVVDGHANDGNPQVSAGIPLKNLPDLFAAAQIDIPDHSSPVADLSQQDITAGRMIRTAKQHVDQVLNSQPKDQPASDKLRGLLMLIAAYLISGATRPNQSYFKGVAPMMARTDFAAMFKLLKDSEKEQLAAQNGQPFVDLALRCADPTNPYAASEPILRSVAGENSQRVPFTEVTRDVWLRRITQGTDVLTKHGYPTAFPNNAEKAEHFESMGAFREGTDTSRDKRPAPVVELRRMRKDLPEADWGPVLLGVFDLITKLNKPKNLLDKARTRKTEYRRAED